MFISLYFPFVDFRRLLLSESELVNSPTWPVFLTSQMPFQRNLGCIESRPRGPLRGWVREGQICEVDSSIVVEINRTVRVRKRFYFDGTYNGYFSMSFSGLSRLVGSIIQEDQLLTAIRYILDAEVRSRHIKGFVTVQHFGGLFADVYGSGTTRGTKNALNKETWRSLISVAQPIIIAEIPTLRFTNKLRSKAEAPPHKIADAEVYLYNIKAIEYSNPFPAVIVKKTSRSEDLFARQARMILSRLFCEFHFLEQAVHFLSSAKSRDIINGSGEHFCCRLSDSISRLYGKKRIGHRKDPSFYYKFSKLFVKSFGEDRVDALVEGLEVFGAKRNLRNALMNTHLWDDIANIEKLELVMEKVMGNKYENSGVVGAMGDHAAVNQSTFKQNRHLGFLVGDVEELKSELEKLQKCLMADKAPEAIVAAKAIAKGKKKLEEGDQHAVMTALSRAGKWAIDTATKIGVPLAQAALKKAANL